MARQLNESRNRTVNVQQIIIHGDGWPADEKWRMRSVGDRLVTEFWTGIAWEERDGLEG